jgi:diguanylate cyclase (GGDEF)-like protein
MRWQLPGILRSWLKQERQALANPGWRTMLMVATPLLLLVVGLEGARRLHEKSQQLEDKQHSGLDLLHWMAEEQRRTALDWSQWDDTFDFAEGSNPEFPTTDMDTTPLLTEAVMAIWGPAGQLLAIRGGGQQDPAGRRELQRCLSDVDGQRRSSGAQHMGILCAGGDQLYVGALESIRDNTASRRSDASLAFVAPLLNTDSGKPLAASLRTLRSELLLKPESGGRTSTARALSPPLWTTGGQKARVLPPATLSNTLPALLPLAGLTAASAAIALGLRLQWMLGMRRQLLQARRSDLTQGRRIRRLHREISNLLEQGQSKNRSDQVGAFARLLQQQSTERNGLDGPDATNAIGPRPQARLVQKVESLLANARGLVLYDILTGLPNRSYFLQQLTWESEQYGSQGIPLALLFINIDRFKRINETYGHNAGDRILQHVARELKRLIQPHDFLARFGGDEFGLIINTSDLQERSESEIRDLASQRARSLLDQFNSLINLDSDQLNISLSIGIALSDLRGSSPEELIRRSDQAMVIAKQRRSSAISVFDINCDAHQLPDYRLFNALESDLNEASEHFQVLFQPIVGIDGRMVEVEALARWRNAQFPDTSPDLFMGLAERYRLIDRLGKLMIERSLNGFNQLRQELPQGSSLQLAINISPSQLLRDGFAPWLLEQIGVRKIPASAITLEVTESAVIETTHDFTVNIANLRQAGMRLALDDFGTGFSSLRLLMALRPDELKIDKSFVLATLNDNLALQIVLLLQKLSETMTLTLVAEGVEDELTRDRLVQAGVRFFQGYLYARPASPADLIASQRLTAPRSQERHP